MNMKRTHIISLLLAIWLLSMVTILFGVNKFIDNKKIELIEKNIIDNKNKVYLIKEKLIKSKELNRNTLTKVKKLNDKN